MLQKLKVIYLKTVLQDTKHVMVSMVRVAEHQLWPPAANHGTAYKGSAIFGMVVPVLN